MKILFIGDVIGEPGRKTVARQVPRLVRERGVDCVIANAENAAGGFGVTPDVARELFAAGVHVLTSGNHIWDKKEIIDYIKDEPRLLRPANYPKGVPGFGSVVVTTAAGEKDRKSTRLNSSHGYISYAVFCLKKKKNIDRIQQN